MDPSTSDLSESLEKLTIDSKQASDTGDEGGGDKDPSFVGRLDQLRRAIQDNILTPIFDQIIPILNHTHTMDPSTSDLSESLGKLTISPKKQTSEPGDEGSGDKSPSFVGLLNQLRHAIQSGECDKVEEMIWSNPKLLVTVCDSAVYLMAGPKYNACHIAAKANKPDIMALLLDTISNINFMKKIYPNEAATNVQDRVNHLLDSYLNTRDPRQGSTPLHFACKMGHYQVVRVLLTFEACDLNLKDSAGLTAEESICIQSNDKDGDDSAIKKKIKKLFKSQLNLPSQRDLLKKRLILAKRLSKAGANFDSDISFSDDSFTFPSPNKESNISRISALASPTTETIHDKYH